MLKSLRRKLIGDLKANRGQFLAVWVIVTLGTTFYGAMYPAAVNLVQSLYNTFDDLRYMDFQVQTDSATPEQLEAVRALPGVAYVEGRLIVEGGLQVDPDQAYLLSLRLISLPDQAQASVNRTDIVKGSAIHGPGELLLLNSFARYHHFEPGDTINVMVGGTFHEFRIAGLVFNPEYLVAGRGSTSPWPTPSTFGVAWLPYSELATLTDQQGVINDIAIRLTGDSQTDHSAIEDEMRRSLTTIFAGPTPPVIYSRLQTPSGGVIQANINGNFPIMIFFSGLFLAGGAIITGILMARMVEGERQRIGTMRAMGITRRELVIHYLAFGFIIGLTGGLVGSVLGYLNSFWFMYTFLDFVAGGTLPGFVNTPQIPFILLGLLIVTASSTVAGAYPAWVQSATPPGIALRPATPKTPHAVSRLPLRFLPLTVRQTVRNLLRTPGRAIGTAIGVIAGAMMLFTALTMLETLERNFNNYYAIPAFDLRVDFSTLLPDDARAAQVAALDGVAEVRAALIGPISIARADGTPFDTVAVVVDGDRPFFTLETMRGAKAFSSPDGVWLGHNTQRVLGVAVGDTLTLRAFDQERQVRVLGVVSQAVGSPVYLPRALVTRWTPGGVLPTNTALVRVQPGQETAVRDAVIALPGVTSVEIVDDYNRDVAHYLSYYSTNTVLFGSFGLILTLALLFNTVNASLRERREELAILRALGSTPREIALTITLELLIMSAVGVCIGLPGGRYAGFWLNDAYQTEFFGQVNRLSSVPVLVGIACLLVVVVVSEIPGLRAVHRADLGQISKSQSF